MAGQLQVFRRELEKAANLSDESSRENAFIHLVGNALGNATSEKAAGIITAESSAFVPPSLLLTILLPQTEKVPDYIVEGVFEEVVPMAKEETLANILTQIATWRYAMIEKIAHRTFTLIEHEDLFDELLKPPGNA